VELIGAKDAAMHNGHTSTAMVSKVYDVRYETREKVNIASLSNKFA
jgi:hypothetical protein